MRYSSTSNKSLLLCSFEVYFPDQRRIFIFSFGGGGGVDKYLGGGAAACFGRGVVATPGKAKEKV